MATTQFVVTVQLSNVTLTALVAKGYSLYGCVAVKPFSPHGAVIWFRLQKFLPSTVLTWSDSYLVYTSPPGITAGSVVEAKNSYALQAGLGQTFTVTPTSKTGVGTVSGEGEPGTVTLLNQSGAPFTSGLELPAPDASGPAPICALPLYGQEEIVLVPGTDLYLMFATDDVPAGTVLTDSLGQGVLIPLTPDAPTATVQYDIVLGWSQASISFPPGTTGGGSTGGGSTGGGTTGGGSTGGGSTSGGTTGGGSTGGGSTSGGSTGGGTTGGGSTGGGTTGGGSTGGGSTDGGTTGGGTTGGGSTGSGSTGSGTG